MKKLALVLLAMLLAVPAFGAGVLPYVPPTDVDLDARVSDNAALYSWLTSLEGVDKGAPFEVQVPLAELAALKAYQPTNGPLLIGVQGQVGFTFDATAKAQPFGTTTFADGNMVWSGTFRSAGATGVRLHLEKVALPKGAELYVYDRHGQAFGPYTRQGSLWTNTVAGDEIVLQLHLPVSSRGATVARELFQVTELGHMGDRYSFGFSGDKAFCSWNDTCIINAECASIPGAVQVIQDAVAYLLYSAQGGTYLCTGGLLNDTGSTQTPYLLTANHCFSNQTSASSLEAYFQWTVSCGSSCGSQFFPPGSVPRTVGSTLLASDSGSDFTLVELDQSAPAGSAFLGWTTADVANANGTNLYRVSHPAGSPQAYSEHQVNTSAGTCRTLPRGDFIYSDATLADTEGGSSGSPVVNGSAQVVGQLFGACGASPSTTCDGDDSTVDGAFAVTYSSVAQWLDPGGGPTCAPKGDSCTQDSDCCSNKCKGPSGSKTCK
jgi:V8-like Glu-specific endopeptidase